MTVTEELARRGIRGEVLVDAMGSRGKDEVVKAAQDAFAGGMDDADEALTVAKHVTDAGAHDVAALLYRATARWAPNRPEAWAGLARELAAASSDPKDQQLVLVALRRARELAPGDAKYRAELALRSGQARRRRAPRPRPATTSAGSRRSRRSSRGARASPRRAPPDVADRELHWLRAVRMHADNRVSQLIQYAREIVIAPRTQQELFEPIPPEGDLTEILRARVHRKEGGVAFPIEEHNDGARPRIRWPELEAGDTVEVVIRQWTSTAVGGRGDAPFYFMDYAGAPASHPLLYNEVVVETLPGHPLYVDVLHDKLAPYTKTEKDERGMHVVRLVWDKPADHRRGAARPAAHRDHAGHRRLDVQDVGRVPQVVRGGRPRLHRARRRGPPPRRRAHQGQDDARGEAPRALRVRRRRHPLRQLRERRVVAAEPPAAAPRATRGRLRRQGDPPHHAAPLGRHRGAGGHGADAHDRSALRAALEERRRADVRSRHRVPARARTAGSTSTRRARSHGSVRSRRWTRAPSRSAWTPAPPRSCSCPRARRTITAPTSSWTVTLGADGSGEVTGEERHTGDAAFWLRTNLTQAEARAQYVEDALVGPWFPTVEVDKKIDFKGDLPGGQSLVKYKAKSRGLARHEGKDLVLSLSPSNTLGSPLAPLVERTLPVQLPPHLAPSHQNRTMRVLAPAGYRLGRAPARRRRERRRRSAARTSRSRRTRRTRARSSSRGASCSIST